MDQLSFWDTEYARKRKRRSCTRLGTFLYCGYAGQYLTASNNNAQCGTWVNRWWQVYDLTADLNTAWTAQLAAINSVFAKYYLIGSNWGASIEPIPGKLDNGSVPAFLGNSTMETYIQTDPQFGNCVTPAHNCHTAAPGKTANPSTTAPTLASSSAWPPNKAAKTSPPAPCSTNKTPKPPARKSAARLKTIETGSGPRRCLGRCRLVGA